MLGRFFKPKWQHKDANIRTQSVSSLGGESPELIQLAQTDPDMGVRMEAALHLTHLPTLIQLGHQSGSLGERARQRVIGLAATDNKHDVLLADVFSWLNNPMLIRSIARDPLRGAKLRRHALETINDQELLFDIANADPSKEIQFLAAQAITDLTTLKQLDKMHGKNNKRLRQLLKERIETTQQQQAIQHKIAELCEQANTLGKTAAWNQDKTRVRILQQAWQTIERQTNAAQKERFQHAVADFQTRLNAHETQVQRTAPIREAKQRILTALQQHITTLETSPEDIQIQELDADLAILQQHWAQQEALPEDVQNTYEKQWQESLAKFKHLRETLGADLTSLATLQALCQTAETLRQQDKAIARQTVLNLKDAWANVKQPKHLRHTVSPLEQHFQRHLEALNARLEKQQANREQTLQGLRTHLATLETNLESEQYGEAIEQHQALLQRLKDTPDLPKQDVAYFQKRIQMLTPYIRELQDWRRWGTDQARKQLIETAENLRTDSEIEPQERAKKVQALRKEWRQLSTVEPAQQQQLWKEFDATVTAAYEPSKQHFTAQAQQRDKHLQARHTLCESLETLNASTDWNNVEWRTLHNQVNQLRKQWKESGTINHKDWKNVNERFNAAMDALEVHFNAERTRNWQAREALVEQANALLTLDNIAQAIEQAKQLQSQWFITLGARPADEQRLWKQFREPIDALFARSREERQQKRDAQHAEKQAAQEQLELKRQEDVARKQQKLAELDALAVHSTDLKQATADEDTLATNQSIGEILCLQLEILLEHDTPAAFQAARMQYQIAHMRDAMSGVKQGGMDITQQALTLLTQWYQVGAMPTEAFEAQQARIDAVRPALLQ